MSGKIIGVVILGIALIAGAALYYLQVYHWYDEVAADTVEIQLTGIVSGQPETIPVEGLQVIDAGSSPIRFRACFSTPLSTALLSETYQMYEGAEPLTAPAWFECFDAEDIGAALEDGRAMAFVSQLEVRPQVDRVVAVFEDGRAFAWHQFNPEFAD